MFFQRLLGPVCGDLLVALVLVWAKMLGFRRVLGTVCGDLRVAFGQTLSEDVSEMRTFERFSTLFRSVCIPEGRQQTCRKCVKMRKIGRFWLWSVNI